VVHVDETEVKLKHRKGYVWVFASLDAAVFMYRPTREGAFLKELLKGFSGVLVSDFYGAYDGLDCPQQKCLVHLMRDMNQELLNNPYDEELHSLTQPFGEVLREIVETVDRHGLRARKLARHQRKVDRFFRDCEEQSFRSEAAEAVRERLLRNKNKLFTFLQHDGVPWNNNCAENAIKRFAYYREGTVGTLSEKGLVDYLILLSLCHTCRYRNISFLRFLLSGERNITEFSQRRRGRRKPPRIQLYPKGFVPPIFRKRAQVGVNPQPGSESATDESSSEGKA
jgi:Transposase IS66 family